MERISNMKRLTSKRRIDVSTGESPMSDRIVVISWPRKGEIGQQVNEADA